MPSTARRKVAEMLVRSLASEGLRVNSVRPAELLADHIWCAQGGATKLNVARWGVDCTCEEVESGTLIRIQIGSFMPLTSASKEKSLPCVWVGPRLIEI